LTPSPYPGGRTAWLCILVASLALRIPALFHDFWLDEVWSYFLVQEFVSSPLDVLTRLHIDNNHPINSWILYALGEQHWWGVYRIPSLMFGVGAVWLAGRLMRQHGRPHAVAAMVVVACSYPMIVYSSEARGYAAMVFFALMAIAAHQRYFATGSRGALLVFWAAAVMGFLSHLTFLHAYGAIVFWSVAAARRRGEAWPDTLVTVARCHAVPILSLAALYVVHIRHLQIGGAEPAELLTVIAETVSMTIGAPVGGATVWLALPMCVTALGVALYLLRRSNPELFILFFSGIVLVPGLTIAFEWWAKLSQPRVFPRYFLVSIALSLLLAAWVVGQQYQRGGRHRQIAMLLVAVFVLGNLSHVARFFADGRGHYRDALSYIGKASNGEVRVSSNSDFRTGMLLAFYRRYLPSGQNLIFYPGGSPRSHEARWRIREDLEPMRVPAEINDAQGHLFQLRARFPFYGLSGCQWSLYERVDAAPVRDLER
jgi:hypothetical protein